MSVYNQQSYYTGSDDITFYTSDKDQDQVFVTFDQPSLACKDSPQNFYMNGSEDKEVVKTYSSEDTALTKQPLARVNVCWEKSQENDASNGEMIVIIDRDVCLGSSVRPDENKSGNNPEFTVFMNSFGNKGNKPEAGTSVIQEYAPPQVKKRDDFECRTAILEPVQYL